MSIISFIEKNAREDPNYHSSSNVFSSASRSLGGFFGELGNGLKNWWYSVTGRNYLTPDAQHAEELERSKNQITAQDLEKAGISRYAMSSNGFSAPDQTGKGGKMLDAILATQQIQAQAQALKEQRYNYKTSKSLGIRTTDDNPLAEYSSLVKILLGKDISDLPDDGLLGYLRGLLFPVDSGSNVVTSSQVDVPKSSVSGLSSTHMLKPGKALKRMDIPDTSNYDRARYDSSLAGMVSMYVKDGLLGWNGKSVVYDDDKPYFKIVSGLQKQYNLSRNEAVHLLRDLVKLVVEGHAGNSSHSVFPSGSGYGGGSGYAW